MKITYLFFVMLSLFTSLLSTNVSFANNTVRTSVIHGIPGVPVDVFVDGSLFAENFQPKTIAENIELSPGHYRFDISPAGAGIAQSVISTRLDILPDDVNISLVAFLREDGTPDFIKFNNDVNDLTRTKRIALRHVAAAPAVDIKKIDKKFSTEKLVSAVTNGLAAEVEFSGSSDVTLAVSLAGQNNFVLGPANLQVSKNSVAYVIGSAVDGTLDILTQRLPVKTVRTSTVSVIHGIPTVPSINLNPVPVDVYLNSELILDDFKFGTVVKTALPVSEGNNIDICPSDSIDNSNPIVSALDVNIPLHADLSIIAHLDANGVPAISIFRNDEFISPEEVNVQSDNIKHISGVVVRHLANAPIVDVDIKDKTGEQLLLTVDDIANGAEQGPIFVDPNLYLIDVKTADKICYSF